MANTGEEFESYVQYIYRTLLDTSGKNITVARRADIYDSRGHKYNIDVSYEFDVAGVHHRVAVECKDTRRPIGRDEVLAFEAKIRNLPNTIGVFISRSGFQAGAREYLEDHGITHFTGDDLPQFGNLIAMRIKSIALPDESAVGQPFWGLMELRASETTGTWMTMPDANGSRRRWRSKNNKVSVFPLFYSKPHAEWYRTVAHNDSPNVCVRGIEQQTLRYLALTAHGTGLRFAICQPFYEPDTHEPRVAAQSWSAVDLAREYSMEDMSPQFDEAPRQHTKFSSR